MSRRTERKVIVKLVEANDVVNTRMLAEVIARKMIERGF